MNENVQKADSFEVLKRNPITSASDEVIHSLILSLAWFLAGRAIQKAKASARVA